MKKKHIKHGFSVQVPGASVTKSFAAEGAADIELVALPVLPASPFRTVDSRSGIEFSYDAAALIATHVAKGRKLPVDIEHATEGAAADTKARGWVHSLTTAELEPDAGLEPGVLYAWVELTPLGKQELADKLWGYTSGVAMGVWTDEQSILFTRIKSLALTNSPATEMPMNFTADEQGDIDAEDVPESAGYTGEQPPSDDAMLAKILEALGLTAETAEADILSAIAALRTPAVSEAEQALTAIGFTVADLTAGAVVKAEALTAVQADLATATEQLTAANTALATATEQLTAAQAEAAALTTQLTAAQTQVAQLTAAAETAKFTSAVDAAITARKFKPAQRDALLQLAQANFAAFQALEASSTPLDLEPVKTGTDVDGTYGLTAEQLALCKTNGIDPAIYAKNLKTLS